MPVITFRAFSELRFKFEDLGVKYAGKLEVPEGITAIELFKSYGFDESEMEAVFVNHKVVPKDTVLQEGDRVSIVPTGGIPGHVVGYIGKKGID